MGTRQQERRWEYLRDTGRPSLLAHDTPEVQWALSKIRSYSARGMSMSAMAEQVGLVGSAITRLLVQERPSLRRTTFEKIRRIQFDDQALRGEAPLLGSQRRLRALRADGFPYALLSEGMGHLGTSPWLLRIITGEREPGKPVGFLKGSTVRDIERMYDKFAGVDPVDIGVSQFAVRYSQNRAAKLGYAPSSCWDPQTIDDPQAIPEWTGRCGTVFGARIHRRDKIPMCEACSKTDSVPLEFSGEKLLALRERHGLTQQGLEKAVGLSKGHVHHWESGRYAPRPAVLDRVLSVLDATFEDVYEIEDK